MYGGAGEARMEVYTVRCQSLAKMSTISINCKLQSRGCINMEFKHLISFISVVRNGSFSLAAKELFLSQPTVSQHIRQLEDELQTRLIVRTTKSFEVTEKGRRVFEDAKNILALRERILSARFGDSRRIISIGASTIPAVYILPEILPPYVSRRPDVYFTISQGSSESVLGRLADGLTDLALVGVKPADERLTALPFYEDSVVLITPVNNHFLELAARGDAPLSEFLKEPMILREEGAGGKKALDIFLENAGTDESELTVSARVNDPEAVKNLVAEGLGISVISEKAAENYRRENRILTFHFPAPGCSRKLYIVQKKDAIPKEDVADFVKYLIQFYKDAVN